MVAAVSGEAPVTPVSITVQKNIEVLIVLFKATSEALVEQITCVAGVAVITGLGFTITVTVVGKAGQPPAALGVII